MTVFYTSDLHLGHRLVAKFRYQRRFPEATDAHGIPESALAWHDDMLAAAWDTTVTKDDVVWVLGDLSLTNSKSGVQRVLEWIAARPGRKHLVPGNHDPVHPLHRDAHKWQRFYLDSPHTGTVFESVQLAARRKFAMPDGTAREVLLSHLPYAGDRNGADRETQWRLRNEGHWLLHGHLHGSAPFHTVGTKQLDVGLDAWGLLPVAEQTLITLMASIEDPANYWQYHKVSVETS